MSLNNPVWMRVVSTVDCCATSARDKVANVTKQMALTIELAIILAVEPKM